VLIAQWPSEAKCGTGPTVKVTPFPTLKFANKYFNLKKSYFVLGKDIRYVEIALTIHRDFKQSFFIRF